MVVRPATLPKWAEEDQEDPETGNNNVVPPPPEKMNSGWVAGEFPPRNWFNWLARWTYRNLAYLIQQEAKEVVTNNDGLGLFPLQPGGTSMCILYAQDIADPTRYLFAIGANNAGTLNFNIIDSNELVIPDNPIVGANVPIIDGAIGPNTVIMCGQTKVQAT